MTISGTELSPIVIPDDDDGLSIISVSDDGEDKVTDEDLLCDSAFEKVEEFAHHLEERNPWHPDLSKKLFPSQIIGFRWMASRHPKGGGLVGDKVGCGKVAPAPVLACIDNRLIRQLTFCYGFATVSFRRTPRPMHQSHETSVCLSYLMHHSLLLGFTLSIMRRFSTPVFQEKIIELSVVGNQKKD
jgi:hypothetical protein